jgi:glycogen(starch) synthase
MKILTSSFFFYPSVGGIEQVSQTLATEFSTAGHEVTVITTTPMEGDEASFPFTIERRPSHLRLLELTRWCDVYFQNNISLQYAWPLLFFNRPWVIAHHTWIARLDTSMNWRDRIKQYVARFAENISISKPIATHLTAPSVTIGNPYRDDLFRRDSTVQRDRELIFVGRLVKDKGVDILFEALRILSAKGVHPNLTIVGTGPEQKNLEALADEFWLSDQVSFAGIRTGVALSELLNRHRIIVVPSRWQEPSGLVALEGVACGCRAIVSNCGGLTEAVGDVASLFKHEDSESLASEIARHLNETFDWATYWKESESELQKHKAKEVAARYLEIIESARPVRSVSIRSFR